MQEPVDVSQLLPGVPSVMRRQALIVVCRQCSKRGSGPRSLKSKQLARTLRDAMRTGKTRCRVVLSTCMGLCPKRGIAVANTATSATGALWSVGSLGEGRRLAGQWVSETAPAANQIPPSAA